MAKRPAITGLARPQGIIDDIIDIGIKGFKKVNRKDAKSYVKQGVKLRKEVKKYVKNPKGSLREVRQAQGTRNSIRNYSKLDIDLLSRSRKNDYNATHKIYGKK